MGQAEFLAPEQLEMLNNFASSRAQFAPLPGVMFKIRASDQWNMANHHLVSEVETRAKSLLSLLLGPVDANGSRSGGMVDNQADLLRVDAGFSAEKTNFLLTVQWGLLALGAAIAHITAASIVPPINEMTGAMGQLAQGNLDIEIPAQNRGDEIGDMASAVQVVKENAIKVAHMNVEEQARSGESRKRASAQAVLMNSLEYTIVSAVAGDLKARVNSDFEDEDFKNVAANVNSLLETVDRGISETGTVLSALADTDLSRRLAGDYQDAFARLKEDTNSVGDKLSDIVSRLRDISGGLRMAVGEILAGANDLSDRTTQQAATIEQTSATMEQLTTTVNQNAAKAEEGSQKANAVSQSAEESGEMMSQTTTAMERIRASSDKISNIVSVFRLGDGSQAKSTKTPIS